MKSRKFDEASSLSNKVIEWMSNFAGIFWLRLLAKDRCSSIVGLLGMGEIVKRMLIFAMG